VAGGALISYDSGMGTPPGAVEDFRRYAELVGSLLSEVPVFTPEVEAASALQVERSAALASLLRNSSVVPSDRIDRILELTRSDLERLRSIAVVDRRGHHRPLYRPLLIYSALQCFSLVYETLPRSEFGRWEEGLRAWADVLEAELGQIGWDSTSLWAGRGASAAEACWTGLALHAAGKIFVRDAWTDLASDTFGKLTRSQQPSGAYLDAGPGDNPETRWYHELAILHAAASYAVAAEDRHVASGVRRSTAWHQMETQPDHATAEPFGVFAFIWNPQTKGVAEGMMHAVRTAQPGGVDGVSAFLLADGVQCLRRFL
jgi:hypothetical protein